MANLNIIEQLLVEVLQFLHVDVIVLQLRGVLLLAALRDHGLVGHGLLDPADQAAPLVELERGVVVMRRYRLVNSRFIFCIGSALVISHELDHIESLAALLKGRQPLWVPLIQMTLSALILVLQVHVHLVLRAQDAALGPNLVAMEEHGLARCLLLDVADVGVVHQVVLSGDVRVGHH